MKHKDKPPVLILIPVFITLPLPATCPPPRQAVKTCFTQVAQTVTANAASLQLTATQKGH